MTTEVDRFKDAMTEWTNLKKQLDHAKKDIKVLNNQEKALREFIRDYMQSKEIDVCNVHGGSKVLLKTRTSTYGFNKNFVKTALVKYFNNDDAKAEHVYQFIIDQLEVRETSSVSLKTKPS
jgi:hypothetical protein